MGEYLEYLIIGGLILLAIFLPPSKDPAIRLKEWNEKQRNQDHE